MDRLLIKPVSNSDVAFEREEGFAAPCDPAGGSTATVRGEPGSDPIFEVHPAGYSALCHLDGDEGSPVVRREGNKHVLVGIYVGSVTQSFTDCRKGTQFLDGYESMFGYGDFLRGGIARVAK